jgi:hypothetical protein
MILYPNLTKEKNNFMDVFIEIIKSQIEVFINIINENDSKKIYEIINFNNQNLSNQITDLYNIIDSNLTLFDFHKKYEIIKNKQINSKNNNNSNQKIFRANPENYKNEEKKQKLKKNINKSNESPIKINLEIQKITHNNKYLPLELSTHISSYTSTNTKIKNNFFNLQTFNNNTNNNNNTTEKKIHSYSTLKNLKDCHNNLSEKKKLKHKIKFDQNSRIYSRP